MKHTDAINVLKKVLAIPKVRSVTLEIAENGHAEITIFDVGDELEKTLDDEFSMELENIPHRSHGTCTYTTFYYEGIAISVFFKEGG